MKITFTFEADTRGIHPDNVPTTSYVFEKVAEARDKFQNAIDDLGFRGAAFRPTMIKVERDNA